MERYHRRHRDRFEKSFSRDRLSGIRGATEATHESPYRCSLAEHLDTAVINRLKEPEPIRKRGEPAPVPERLINGGSTFQAVLGRADIEDFRFHDLCLTFASHIIMRGVSLKDLQKILGHKYTALRHAHFAQEHKKKAVNLLNGLTAYDQSKRECHKTVTTNFASLWTDS